MPAYRAAWLIGSYADMPASSMTINATAVPVAAGSRYLYDADAALSMLSLIEDIITAGGVAGASVRLNQNGTVRLSGGGLFSVTWGAATLLRDLLGFTADLPSNASHTAPNLSPLLWMPGKPETPLMQRLGVVGHRTHAVYTATAPYSGKQESVSHGERFFAKYAFPMVDTDRMVGDEGEGGTFDTWFTTVAVRSARWKLYREVLEDLTAFTSAMSYLDQPLGPYVVSGPQLRWKWDPSRGFERTDARADAELSCHVVEEYT